MGVDTAALLAEGYESARAKDRALEWWLVELTPRATLE